MKDKLLRFLSYVVVAMLATAITLQMTVKTGTGKLDRLENLIQERYIGEADGEAMEDAAAAAMVKATGDRWSYYIPASQYEAHKEQSENAYVGIGITIQQAEDGSGFLIVMVNQNGPAQEAGVQVNDLLIAVEDQDIREMTADQVRELIRGGGRHQGFPDGDAPGRAPDPCGGTPPDRVCGCHGADAGRRNRPGEDQQFR